LTELPRLSENELAQRLRAALPEAELEPAVLRRLYGHYEELRRWAPRVDLIGPGSAARAVERHFAESLAALPFLPAPARSGAPQPGVTLLDLGSGAGFPGLVLAAARPDLEVVLVEPRERRRAFLAAVARRAGLRVAILGARVSTSALSELPDGVAVVTARALRLESTVWSALAGRLAPGAALLLWTGASPPEIPELFEPQRALRLPESRERMLREYRLREL
jgi:16S rRNA (guanine527-N7)-methyltransferase